MVVQGGGGLFLLREGPFLMSEGLFFISEVPLYLGTESVVWFDRADSERRRNNFKGGEDFYLEAKARSLP